MAFKGIMGGFFDSLGWTGAATVIGGAGLFSFAHGMLMDNIRGWFETGAKLTADDKADMAASAILGTIPIIFGALRMTRFDYPSDWLDGIGNVCGGGLTYEGASVIEVLSAALK